MHSLDVVEELAVDHREAEALFDQIRALPPADARRKHRADDLTILLVRHIVAEEEYLHPAVREQVAGGAALVEEAAAEDGRIQATLKELEHHQAHDPGFDDLVDRLAAEVSAHAESQEHRIFPALRSSCTTDELQTLGRKVRHAKTLAPTRPHPAEASNKLLTPAVGLVDRLRDLLSGRGHAV
ncbi:hemerythrin domain-containing protein [Streptomyces sp. NRRL B-24484]|uniref:hemerythrin domain-containing protein n=1 Tax=Streptomyces sp. NRRL B-24484 TaxID=1463833 RepID=UPI0004C26032|nr:hemerythrin domain-containing protein [Streptomyces sp. NRRL B-24484]